MLAWPVPDHARRPSLHTARKTGSTAWDFLPTLGAGAFYFFASPISNCGSRRGAHATGDYGTRLFAAAGMLNLLTVLEAYDIGRGFEAK